MSTPNQSDSENENQSIQPSSSTDVAPASSSGSTIDYFKPVGTSEDGKPMYDRTGITLFDMKKHEGKDGKQLCAFGGSVCTQRPMKTYDFCVKHVLQDPTAPFKRCEYIGKGSKQCGNPVKLEVGEDIKYCNTHKQKMGITPKTKKKKSEEKTPAKRGRKKEKKDEPQSETTPEAKDVKEIEKTTPEILPPSSSAEATTTLATSITTTTPNSTTTNISSLSTSLEPILPYPINCANNNEDTDSDDYTGVSKPFDTRKEQKPKKSPPQKRKRKFNKKPQQDALFAGSDTESDVPTDDDECMEETYLYPPYSSQGNGVQCLTEMEFLRIRKHHIESLLKLYRGRHKKMKNELERKYTEFLIQRELAANSILFQNQNSVASDIKIRLKKVNFSAYYNPKNRMNDTESVVLPTVNFPPENQQIYQCNKVEKYHETSKEPLCCYPNCFSKRLIGVEYCLPHIIYDQKQRLYVPSTGSTPLYASSSDVNTKIPKEATLAERTVVVIENANKLTSPQWQINSEQDKHIQTLLKKFKGDEDLMQIDNVPISEDLSK